ncbi:MAG: hypothetical protein H6R16_1165 [Proteobacteria bacterium]|nr:hypothetical protein [Pseudomonadota bacterium]
MLQAILDNHLLLSIIVLFILIMVPALILRGRGVREIRGTDRRRTPRAGTDRRA